MGGPEYPNMAMNLWSEVPYSNPYDPIPRSVDEAVVDPSLSMGEPIVDQSLSVSEPVVDPSLGSHSEPFELPASEPIAPGASISLYPEFPPTPPGTCICTDRGVHTEPRFSPQSFKRQCAFRHVPTREPTPHLLTR